MALRRSRRASALSGWFDPIRQSMSLVAQIDDEIRFAFELWFGRNRYADLALRGPIHLAHEVVAALRTGFLRRSRS